MNKCSTGLIVQMMSDVAGAVILYCFWFALFRLVSAVVVVSDIVNVTPVDDYSVHGTVAMASIWLDCF